MTTVNIYPTHDSEVNSDDPNATNGSDTRMDVKYSSGSTFYGYVQFDISGINVADITSCTLRLREYIMEDPSNIRIYRLNGTFDESSLCWNNKPSIDSSSYVNCQFGSPNPKEQTINILSLIQNETGSTFGIRLQCVDSGTYTGGSFYTSESSYKPLLTIEYTSVPDPTTDWYVTPSGSGAKNGYDWDNAMDTIDQAMDEVVAGGTVHVAFGTYNSEPTNNRLSPGADDVTVIYETATTGGGSGTASVEINS